MGEPLVVTIPMTPPKELFPNNRASRWAKARHAKALREAAYLAAVSCRGNPDFDALGGAARIGFRLTVRWERGRARVLPDDDNVVAACKALRDGVADALALPGGDRRFVLRALTQERADRDDAGGWVRVTLEAEG